MVVMSEKPRKKKRPTQDRHAAGYRMVRLPNELLDQVQALAKENDRPMTWELRRLVAEAIAARRAKDG